MSKTFSSLFRPERPPLPIKREREWNVWGELLGTIEIVANDFCYNDLYARSAGRRWRASKTSERARAANENKPIALLSTSIHIYAVALTHCMGSSSLYQLIRNTPLLPNNMHQSSLWWHRTYIRYIRARASLHFYLTFPFFVTHVPTL